MFTVIEVQENQGQVGVLSYSYETENEALAQYYQILFYASSSSIERHSAIMIRNGYVEHNDCINHPTDEGTAE